MTGNKVIPELHLKQPGFTYSAGGPFTKQVSSNELDKACFAHDDSNDLAKRTISDFER